MEELLLLAFILTAFATIYRSGREQIGVRGDVDLTLTFEDGTSQLLQYHNLVVTDGKTTLAKLLGGDAGYAAGAVDQVAFGTGSTAPVVGNIALEAEVLTKTATVTYPSASSVKFSATMEANEGGTSTYQELGLKSSGTGKLFSRLVITPIAKSTLYKIQVDWTISFQSGT